MPFLKDIAQYIVDHHINDTEKLCVVLPNKRGALYLKQHLAKIAQKTIWLPTIISAEELVANLSELQQADSIDLICDLYQAYQIVLKDKAEPFDSFAKWGNLMLQDFNEADRYLVDTHALYQNLKEIKEIENWSLSANELTQTQQDYCNFMSEMGLIYIEFTQLLLKKKQAYQGLMYRKAVDLYKNSDFINQYNQFLIVGFNALNKAETIIFNDLIKQKKAVIIYDGDLYYVNNPDHEAGLFLRKNFKHTWLNTQDKIGNYFKEIPKHINIVGVPKQIGQAMLVNKQLTQWVNEGKSLHKTAIVLADESLLFPVLNQLPETVKHVNITMEYPLRLSPIYDLVESIINLQLSIQKSSSFDSFYFNDVFKIFQNSVFKTYYQSFSPSISIQQIIQTVINKNYVWFNQKLFTELFQDNLSIIETIFKPWRNSEDGINCINQLIMVINNFEEVSSPFSVTEKEYFYVFTKQFNRLQAIINQYVFLNSLVTLKSLFKQIIGTSSVPFIGEPLQGLQIMGVLETRTLDFENIIFLGINEGVLPSGKTANSFIPNDLKRHHEMPLYGDKDAIYAYHFYRLLQRATHVLLSYNTEQTVLGSGEKSRFITQLQFELKKYNTDHQIDELILGGANFSSQLSTQISITKTPEVLKSIINKLTINDDYNGLSPSALISYKHCGLKFFYRYGASIKETEDVEENTEASTQGTILHETLELLYKPFIGMVVNHDELKACQSKITELVDSIFKNHFTQRENEFGKNYLQKKVLYEYVKKLVKNDLALILELKKNNQYLSIIDLEKKLTATITININGVDTLVYISGSADRIDKIGNELRVIDYKSSINTTNDKFKFTNFEDLFTDKKQDKMLQLFTYAWLIYKNNIAKPEDILPCIIPFKVFEKTPKHILSDSKKTERLILTEELMLDFENHLKMVVSSIINTQVPFEQTIDETSCEYCTYAVMCNKTNLS